MAGESRKRQANTDAGGRQKEPAGNGTSALQGTGRGSKSTGTGAKGAGTRSAGTRKTAAKSAGTPARSAGTGYTGGSRAAKSRRKSEPEKDYSFMGTEVAIIVSFAISVLLFLSNFGLCGVVGNVLRECLLGIFGSMGYVAPILLFIGTCFYLSNRGNRKAAVKMAAVAVLLLALAGLAQLMFGGGVREGQKLIEYYKLSAKSGSGGGFLGGALVTALDSTVGKVGSYLILFAILIIAVVCITERSLVNFVKQRSSSAYQYAREDMDRRRVIHEERREEKRRLREEQRVRGVNFDAMNLDSMSIDRVNGDPGSDGGDAMYRQEEPIDPARAQAYDPEFYADEERIPDDIPITGIVRSEQGPLQDSVEEEESREAELTASGRSLPFTTVEKPFNPADVFRGNIVLPSDKEAREPEAGAGGKIDEDELLKSIYVRQDTRTLEEMALEDSGEEKDVEISENQRAGSRAAKDRGTGLQGAKERVAQSSNPEGGNREYMASADRYAETEGTDVFPDNCRIEDEIDIRAAAQVDDELSAIGPEGVFYDAAPDEAGENYDGFYIPEEPKTVVTSSGKVIETDTEMVRKTIEKKREERKNLPEGELSVNEQIERKAEQVVKKEYQFPSLKLLKKGVQKSGFSDKEYRETAIKLQQTLQNFGVGVTVTNISCGPSVTRYELHPEQGVKVSKIVSLTDDIKLNLAAADIRIEAPIPGKAAVGIEVPNKENNMVYLRDLLESDEFKKHPSNLAFAVGKDIGGQTVVADIAKMPHLLIAGATGSGKSVCINTLIMSVIYKAKPEDVKLIMVDPKVVELSVYNGIPHLLIPVVTDPKKASGALNWAVAEMTDRYQKFAKYNVRDLKGYNAKIEAIKDIEDEDKPEKMPQIVIIVDELADLMMVAPGEVEDAICRLAQLARAAGIHLVIATQRPSVNVITGLIKANIPSRIAFSVSSGVDSRTIIDMNGAEKLLGKGDMLFYPSGVQKPQRVQGAFVSDPEVSSVVEFLTEQGMTSDYNPEIEDKIKSASQADLSSGGGDRDAYFEQAGRFIIEKDKASIGMLQRMFKIGFNRAARIMDQLADAGVVGDEEGTKPRKVLMSMEQFENLMQE